MRKRVKFGLLAMSLLVALGLVVFNPSIAREKKYKTVSFDKVLETKEDFTKGEFHNTKLKEQKSGVELEADGDVGEYTTPVIEAPFEATHIGIHWKESENQKNFLQIRVRVGDKEDELGEWFDVQVMDEEGRNEDKIQEKFSYLTSIWGKRFAQAQIVLLNNEKEIQKLKQFKFIFINSNQEENGDKKIAFAPRITAQTFGFYKESPNGQGVNVISREEWGADESYRVNSNGEEDWPRSYHGTRKLVVHHTADPGSNGVVDLEDNMATLRAIYYYHAVKNLWGDIGYNALVDAAGNIYEGRYGTPGTDFNRSDVEASDVMVLDVEAGHTSGYNSGSFGVSAMGDFTDFIIPSNQREGMKDVLAFVADSRGIDVQGNSDFLRYDGTWHQDLNNVLAHRDVMATECPGDRLYSEITSIKSEVDNLPGMTSNLDNFSATLNGVKIEGQVISSGKINIDWDDFLGATEYRYALEKVFGTIYDPQPWETSWMNYSNTMTTGLSEILIDTSALNPLSQYVLYVGAVDDAGKFVSTIKHINFKTDGLPEIDLIAPSIEINSPLEGYEATENETLSVFANASDNVGVSRIELFYDNSLLITCENSTSCATSIRMRKETVGGHIIEARAYDLAGNSSVDVVNFSKVTSSVEPLPDPDEPKPTKCSPWPACR